MQAVGAGLALASQIVIARSIGVSGYGRYGVWVTVALVAGLVATGGEPARVLGLLSRAGSRADGRQVRDLTGGAWRAVTLGAAGTGGAVAAGTGVGTGDWRIAFAVALVTAGTAALHFGNEVGRGLGLNSAVYGSSIILRPLLLIVTVLVATSTDYVEMSLTTALWGTALATWAAFAVQWAVLRRRRGLRLDLDRPTGWSWSGSAPFLVTALFALLLSNADVLAVALVFTSSEVGSYLVAVRLAAPISLVAVAVSVVITPRLAALGVEGQSRESMSRLAGFAAAASTGVSAGVALGLAALSPWLIGAFGEGTHCADTALFCLLGGQLLRTAAGPAGTVLLYCGERRLAMATSAFGVALVAAGALAGAISAGVAGAGAGVAFGLASGGWLGAWAVHRRLGVRTCLQPRAALREMKSKAREVRG